MNLFIPDHPQIITKRVVLHAKEKVKKRQKGNNNNKTNPNMCEGGHLWSELGSLIREYQEMEGSFSFTANFRQPETKSWKRYVSLSFPQYSHFLLIAWNNFIVQSLLPPATFNILFKCLIACSRKTYYVHWSVWHTPDIPIFFKVTMSNTELLLFQRFIYIKLQVNFSFSMPKSLYTQPFSAYKNVFLWVSNTHREGDEKSS